MAVDWQTVLHALELDCGATLTAAIATALQAAHDTAGRTADTITANPTAFRPVIHNAILCALVVDHMHQSLATADPTELRSVQAGWSQVAAAVAGSALDELQRGLNPEPSRIW